MQVGEEQSSRNGEEAAWKIQVVSHWGSVQNSPERGQDRARGDVIMRMDHR